LIKISFSLEREAATQRWGNLVLLGSHISNHHDPLQKAFPLKEEGDLIEIQGGQTKSKMLFFLIIPLFLYVFLLPVMDITKRADERSWDYLSAQE
jgi:hypothetical protein